MFEYVYLSIMILFTFNFLKIIFKNVLCDHFQSSGDRNFASGVVTVVM